MRICCIGKPKTTLDMKSSPNNPPANAPKKTFFTFLRSQLRFIGLIILFVGAMIQLGAKFIDKDAPTYTTLFYIVGLGLFLVHRWLVKKER
jgi:hypothetical protein